MDARWNSNFRTDVGGGYRVGIKADFSAGLGPPEGGSWRMVFAAARPGRRLAIARALCYLAPGHPRIWRGLSVP